MAVAEELHFGRAAQRLNMLPTTLGRQIRMLEEDLGGRLLVRSTRHVALTSAGMALRQDARRILQGIAEAERKVRQLSKAKAETLRIGAIDSAAAGLLPSMIAEFRELRPDIETRLVECTSVQQLRFLLSGRLDLGFVRPPVRERSLKFEFLFYETLVAAVPEDDPLAARKKILLHDLVGAPLIVPPRQVRPHSFRAIMRAFRTAGEEPRIVLEAAEKQTIVSLVGAGIGIALVPVWVAKLQVPGVVYRPLKLDDPMECPETALGVAWSEDLKSTPCMTFLKVVRDRLARPAGAATASSAGWAVSRSETRAALTPG
ncbi:MAG: LysR family transcriptional regulator [Methylobacteriaceae bacterium]|nr:LysR family transcriptional regulator [Methylobacteriaceae bacterium]